jgi:protein involved in polysaccharide export with SLBB domain
MVMQLGFLLLFSSLAAPLWSQLDSLSNYSGGLQNAGSANCTDPIMASSSQCSGLNAQNPGSMLAPQNGMGMSGGYGLQSQNPYSSGYGAQAQNPNSNYSDIEQFSRSFPGRYPLQPVMLPPEPLTEFQKFAASTTGRILPIFGADLFRSVPSTFAPLDMTPVPSDFVIGPGDELRIRVWGQVNFQANLRVDRSGEVYLPQVGPVHIAGIPYSQLDTHLRQALARVYRNFDLTADVGQIRSIQVYVAGQARRPGVYTVSSLSTMVDALFASGGPSVQGSLRHIELRRGSTVVTDFDLYNLLIHGDKSKDVKLLPGDVIFIPPAGPQVAVTGSVRNSAIFELRGNESLADLLADAGGVTSIASGARVSIERIENHSGRLAMEVAYDPAGLATPLADGDLVHVFSIVPKYSKTVTLRGNIANPGRFAWHAGMHVSDLIPDKDSLITRNYWWKRAQLGLPAPEFEPIPDFSAMTQPVQSHAIQLAAPTPGDMSQLNQAGLAQDQTGLTQNQTGLTQDQAGQQQLQSGLQMAQIGQAQDQNLNAQQRAGSSSLAAQQTSRSVRIPASTQRIEIRSLAPEIDWDYAVIERLDPDTLKTVLVPFDLGKLVQQHDASQDLELQPGDVVSIFSEADIRIPIAHQTKLVTLGGEFTHAGMYTVQPGETLRQLVERAGGFTPNAYLYASEFTRESTRVVQQARLDEYVQSLQMRIQRSNLSMASSAVSSAQDMASAAAAHGSESDLIASLRQIRATGRIVLRFAPDSSGINSIPDIPLEDGDNFTIPSVPATVNVVGAVYDQNSFLFINGKRIGSYLKMAGGPNRDADRRHEFVIRADGEVVSRGMDNTIWGGNDFNNQRISPGDTIVIPEKTFKISALRGVLDWSQTFSQMALGAAVMTAVLP